MISPFRQAQMLERAQGCLLGQLAGDSLGSLVEFRVPDDIRRKYPKGFRELADGDNRVEILNSSLGGLADG
jgi:ADP-ribosylglycohydrolase